MPFTAACEDPCTSRCKTQPKYIKNNYLRDSVLEAPAGAVELPQPLCNQTRRCGYLQRVKILAHHAAKHNPNISKSLNNLLNRTVENEDLQSFERGDWFSQLPHHVAVYVMAHEVQQDDMVLGGSLQPAHELPQLVRPQLPEAWCFVFPIDFPILPGILSQVQLTRELLTGSGVKRKLQVLFEGHDIRNRIGG